MALYDCDMYGSMPYSEAVQFRYGGTLTPKYDSQKELFTKWIEEIDADIKVLSAKLESQASLGNNDLAYNGDAAKWLKFANGVKLKLADAYCTRIKHWPSNWLSKLDPMTIT